MNNYLRKISKNIKFHTVRRVNTQVGFTLFIAMIVTGLILGVGFSITNILLKQLTLSSSGRESQIAFYAADSAAECAIYWDRKNADGSTVDNSPFAVSISNAPVDWSLIKCGTGYGSVGNPGEIKNFTKSDFDPANPNNATSTFYISFVDSLVNACGKVTVAKIGQATFIDARGYNVGYKTNGACDTTHPRTVERGLKINY